MSLKGKRNAYTCEKCGLTIITVDQDEAMKQHFDMGGLDIYPLNEAEATAHQLARQGRLNWGFI